MEDSSKIRQGAVEDSFCEPKKMRTEDQAFGQTPAEIITPAEKLLQKVFGNHLILSNIMRKMKTRNLVTCRLVNSSWKKAADSILVKRKDLKAIDIRFCTEKDKFFLNSYRTVELNELQNILENSTSFPCQDFKIEGPLEHPELQKFLSSSRCGGPIKRLSLNFTLVAYRTAYVLGSNSYGITVYIRDPKKEGMLYLRKLLTEQTVNLNSLTVHTTNLDYFSNNQEAEKLFPSPVILPKLTHLEIIRWPNPGPSSVKFRYMEELLTASPNITSFSTAGIQAEAMTSLINVKKAHLLTKMVVDISSSCPQDDQFLSQFKLKKFTATSRFYNFFRCNDRLRSSDPSHGRGDDDPVIREPSLRVLRLNSNTLTSVTLDLFHAAATLPTAEVFYHVKTFCLIALEKLPEQNTSKISLKELFPNLEKIRLEGNFNAKTPNYGTEENFPFVVDGMMEKVKTLEILHVCPIDWLKLLSQVFPGVTHLILENYWDFPWSGPLFWSFKSVQIMDLGLLLGIHNIDAVFTGFFNRTCDELREKSERAVRQLVETGTMEIETEEEIKKLRVSPSIVRLKELRELRIKIADTDSHKDFPSRVDEGPWRRSRERWRPACQPSNVDLTSPVTSVYAFGMMPTLQSVDISLTPNETKFLPKDTNSLSRLQQLAAALKPMAEHPLVTLYPIQMNN